MTGLSSEPKTNSQGSDEVSSPNMKFIEYLANLYAVTVAVWRTFML